LYFILTKRIPCAEIERYLTFICAKLRGLGGTFFKNKFSAMNQELTNVVVTGASRGIGAAIVERFASEGARIFACALHAGRLEEAVAGWRKKYPQSEFHAYAADLGTKQGAASFAQWVAGQATPDILVNNAGNFSPGSILGEEEGSLEQMLSVNLLSAYHITRILVPLMIKKGRGHIFNMCSIASLRAYPAGGSYGIAKYALAGFSENLREELKSKNIKVTALYPGAVLTESWGDFDNSKHRIMEATDIAQMIFTSTSLSPAAVVEHIVLRPQLGDL
jgi:short-subunit dehydrogenase